MNDQVTSQEQKSIISEVIDLKMVLENILAMTSEPTIQKEEMGKVPLSSDKLENLRTIILDCKDISKEIIKSLRLLS